MVPASPRLGLAAALLLAAPLLLAAAPVPAGAAPLDRTAPLFELQQVAGGLSMPVLATHAGDGSGRLFLVQQGGLVRVLQGGALDPLPYLDVRGKVSCCGERGLLGLAFAPDFEATGRLYVSYTRAGDGYSVLERLTVADPANGRPPASGQVLLTQWQPFSNHNGGHIAFGPDGYLYLGLGDGGAGGDPLNLAQNMNSLLGKMLRLDVSGSGGYTIPPDNPFVGGGGLPEIWASGLRNPWRWSFDRASGDLWIADVGQNQWEEVNRAPRASKGGENYGWNWWEGFHRFKSGAQAPGMFFPVLEYNHSLGCSVTGGYVYRGTAMPWLQGTYLYGDFCSGRIWAAVGVPFPVPVPHPRLPVNLPSAVDPVPGGGLYQALELTDTSLLISSFGEDEAGEMYVLNYGGNLLKLVPP